MCYLVIIDKLFVLHFIKTRYPDIKGKSKTNSYCQFLTSKSRHNKVFSFRKNYYNKQKSTICISISPPLTPCQLRFNARDHLARRRLLIDHVRRQRRELVRRERRLLLHGDDEVRDLPRHHSHLMPEVTFVEAAVLGHDPAQRRDERVAPRHVCQLREDVLPKILVVWPLREGQRQPPVRVQPDLARMLHRERQPVVDGRDLSLFDVHQKVVQAPVRVADDVVEDGQPLELRDKGFVVGEGLPLLRRERAAGDVAVHEALVAADLPREGADVELGQRLHNLLVVEAVRAREARHDRLGHQVEAEEAVDDARARLADVPHVAQQARTSEAARAQHALDEFPEFGVVGAVGLLVAGLEHAHDRAIRARAAEVRSAAPRGDQLRQHALLLHRLAHGDNISLQRHKAVRPRAVHELVHLRGQFDATVGGHERRLVPLCLQRGNDPLKRHGPTTRRRRCCS
eukprot:PhM_4_TR1365/c0_g2_i3/m.92225